MATLLAHTAAYAPTSGIASVGGSNASSSTSSSLFSSRIVPPSAKIGRSRGQGFLNGTALGTSPGRSATAGLSQSSRASRKASRRSFRIVATAATPKTAAAPADASKAEDKKTSGVPDMEKDILFQAFNWESCKQQGKWYDVIKEKIPALQKAGITAVWLPPSSKSVAPQGYLPSQLYNLNDTAYGNEASLKELVKALKAAGIKPVADIVINHRCADKQDENGVWNMFEGGTPDERMDWGPWALTGNDEYSMGKGGAPDTGEDYGAAPDIDHTNEVVQKDLINWMNWLKKDIGFTGWRFDFTKGYGGEFVGLYCEKTSADFAVGELWTDIAYGEEGLEYNQDRHRQQLCDWCDKAGNQSATFDFTTKGILQEAVNGSLWRLKDESGKPSGMIGWWPSRAVTFIENHDTGSTQGHWPFPSDHIMQGYAYILTHPGIPTVFWDHFFDWGLGEEISSLIAARKQAGITATSSVEIVVADADLYMATIAGNLIVKLGPRVDVGEHAPGEEWNVTISGKDYCIWEKKSA